MLKIFIVKSHCFYRSVTVPSKIRRRSGQCPATDGWQTQLFVQGRHGYGTDSLSCYLFTPPYYSVVSASFCLSLGQELNGAAVFPVAIFFGTVRYSIISPIWHNSRSTCGEESVKARRFMLSNDFTYCFYQLDNSPGLQSLQWKQWLKYCSIYTQNFP